MERQTFFPSGIFKILHRLRGEYADSENCLQEAMSIFTDLDTRWQCGKTQFELGKSAQGRGETGAASKAFAEALKYFEELGARPDQERVLHALESIT